MRRVVPYTVDFDRIAAIPRRVPTLDEATAWAAAFTAEFRHEWSAAELRPWQGYGLHEVLSAPPGRGVFFGLPVGFGKTLLMALGTRLLRPERTAYIVPASLEKKTQDDFAALRANWDLGSDPYRVFTRELLGQPQSQGLLDDYAPTVLHIDEIDEFSNARSSAVRRIDRYVVANEHVRVFGYTGTITRNSIMGYWHLLCWCLREGAPVYLEHSEAAMLAEALDENRSGMRRPLPGPWGVDRKSAMAFYRQRLVETPGVLNIDGDSCNAPLIVRERLAREDPVLDEHYAIFLETGEVPGGTVTTEPLSQMRQKGPLSRWQIDGALGLGIVRRYVKPPPEAWLEARRASARFVRAMIERSTRSSKPLDSEAQVYARYPDHPIVREWLAIRGEFDVKTEALWLTDSTIKSVIDWLGESPEPGIVWCGSVDFANALAEATGLRYYARRGRCADGAYLGDAPTGESVIASWNANKKGFNLQSWTRALLVMPPQSAKWLEQIIGRIHRSMQENAVTIDILLTSGGTIDLVRAAIAEARFAKETTGLTQKIRRAKVRHAKPLITPSNECRWATRKDRSGDEIRAAL